MEDKYRSEWQSATDSEIQQFDDKEAMVPISFDEMKGTKPIKSKVGYKLLARRFLYLRNLCSSIADDRADTCL